MAAPVADLGLAHASVLPPMPSIAELARRVRVRDVLTDWRLLKAVVQRVVYGIPADPSPRPTHLLADALLPLGDGGRAWELLLRRTEDVLRPIIAALRERGPEVIVCVFVGLVMARLLAGDGDDQEEEDDDYDHPRLQVPLGLTLGFRPLPPLHRLPPVRARALEFLPPVRLPFLLRHAVEEPPCVVVHPRVRRAAPVLQPPPRLPLLDGRYNLASALPLGLGPAGLADGAAVIGGRLPGAVAPPPTGLAAILADGGA